MCIIETHNNEHGYIRDATSLNNFKKNLMKLFEEF